MSRTRCDCRIVREAEAQRAVVMAFNTLPSRREELVVQRERLLTGEIGRIDALLKTLDENGRMEAFNNDLVIRYLDRVVVKGDGYEVIFKAGVTVEVEV